jgi:hypothetical protein
VVDFPLTLTSSEFVAALQALLDSGWVDQRTRLVLFDHLIYNNEANAFVSVRVSFELQPWGFVRARVQARTMRLGYVRSLDIGLLVLDALVYANVIVSLVLTLKKLLHLRLDFFKVTRASFTRASFYSPSLLVDFSLSLSVSLSLSRARSFSRSLARALSLSPSLPSPVAAEHPRPLQPKLLYRDSLLEDRAQPLYRDAPRHTTLARGWLHRL